MKNSGKNQNSISDLAVISCCAFYLLVLNAPKARSEDILGSFTQQGLSNAIPPPNKRPTVSADPQPSIDSPPETVPQDKSGTLAGEKAGDGADTSAAKRDAGREAAKADLSEQAKAVAAANKRNQDLAKIHAANQSKLQQIARQNKLIREAKLAVEQERDFTAKQAKMAEDEEVRKQLMKVAEGRQRRKAFLKEDARLTDQIAELSTLAAKAMAVSAAMGTTKQSTGSDKTIINTAPASPPSNINIQLPDSAKSSAEAEKTKKLDLEDVGDVKLPSLKDGVASSKKAKDFALKNSLQAKIAAAEKAMATNAANMDSIPFGSSDGKDGTSGVSKKDKAPAAHVTEDLLETPSGGFGGLSSPSGGKFSMNSAETDAAVKEIVDEASRNTASQEEVQAGVMEMESPSLFERCSKVLNSCLRKRCVNSAYAKN